MPRSMLVLLLFLMFTFVLVRTFVSFIIDYFILPLIYYQVLGKPRAIVHIGPPKTASTYIQEFLSHHARDLQKYNLIWPSTHHYGSPKGISLFGMDLANDSIDNTTTEITDMRVFFEENRAQNRSIIISSENFSKDSPIGVAMLKSMLRGFDVTIIYFYREFVSHLLSVYYQLYRGDKISKFEPLSTFVVKNFDVLAIQLDLWRTLRAYEDAFGNEAMVVVDYYGCEAAGVDVAYVVACEVAGALCDRNDLFIKSADSPTTNARESLIGREIFGYYERFIRIYGSSRSVITSPKHKVDHNASLDSCHFCPTQTMNQRLKAFEKDVLKQRHRHILPEIPLIRTHLSMLVPFAEEMDRKLREEYGDEILYGNTTANLKAMHEEAYTEFVDGDALMNSVEWREWMTRTYYEDLKHGRLCGCNAE